MTVKLYDYSRSKKIAEIDVQDPAPPTLSYAGKGWHRFGEKDGTPAYAPVRRD